MLLRNTVAAIATTMIMTGLCDIADAMPRDADQKVIRVTSATYGASCRVPAGNVTKQVAAACNGRKSCNYVVNYKVLGDPARNCKKDFQVTYSCGKIGPFQGSAPAEAGYDSNVALLCN